MNYGVILLRDGESIIQGLYSWIIEVLIIKL
jgi:hypothetical protein